MTTNKMLQGKSEPSFSEKVITDEKIDVGIEVLEKKPPELVFRASLGSK